MEAVKESDKLKERIEEKESVERIAFNKEVSLFHCENCKEEGTDYIYCSQSSINMYKTMYLAEAEIRMKKEEELDEFNNLFTKYEALEIEKSEESYIKQQQTFEEILAELEINNNYKNEDTKDN